MSVSDSVSRIGATVAMDAQARLERELADARNINDTMVQRIGELHSWMQKVNILTFMMIKQLDHILGIHILMCS